MAVLGIVFMVLCLLLVPLGLPGLWLMLAILGVGALSGAVSWWLLVLLALLAGAAELIEFLLVRHMSIRFGGSRRAFWGALAGGILGFIVGIPIPIIGSLLAGLIGTFAGAALVSWHELRDLGPATRVGWGAVLGRAFSAIVKTAAGVIILAFGSGALLF